MIDIVTNYNLMNGRVQVCSEMLNGKQFFHFFERKFCLKLGIEKFAKFCVVPAGWISIKKRASVFIKKGFSCVLLVFVTGWGACLV